jgi:hypothetical protein
MHNAPIFLFGARPGFGLPAGNGILQAPPPASPNTRSAHQNMAGVKKLFCKRQGGVAALP